MSPHLTIVRVLRDGFTALADPTDGKGFALYKSYKQDEIDALKKLDGLTDEQIEDEMERQYAHFVAHRPRIERGFPRQSWSTWPAIFVLILSERDDKRFIGGLAQFDPDDRSERFGVKEECTIGVYTYSENLDELDELHVFAKNIVRGSVEALVKAGFTYCNLQSAQDVEPNPLLPETVFLRGSAWDISGATTWVTAIGPRIDRVYVHLEPATFTAQDGSTHSGGVVPTVDED